MQEASKVKIVMTIYIYSSILLSKNFDQEQKRDISQLLGLKQTHSQDSYLEIPMNPLNPKKDVLESVMNRIKSRIQG